MSTASYCDIVTLTKVCGITRQEDADVCQKLEVGLNGFIFHPGSPRNITPEAAAAIDTGSAMRVGVFVEQTPDQVLEIMRQAKLHMAQLHGDQDEAFCEALGRTRVMRVFWPERYASLDELDKDLDRFTEFCHFFLFDAGSSGGGHGQSFDFGMLAGLKSPKSWFIAGGLGPDNVRQALEACDPCGIDLNSGVETAPGIKDASKLKATLKVLCDHDSHVGEI